jgi:rubredoxin
MCRKSHFDSSPDVSHTIFGASDQREKPGRHRGCRLPGQPPEDGPNPDPVPPEHRASAILGFTGKGKFYIDVAVAAVISKRGGLTNRPTSAPELKKEDDMDRYVCTICGYVYDPAQGDPDNGIAAGTPFKDLPDDWECPVCGAAKADFEKEE